MNLLNKGRENPPQNPLIRNKLYRDNNWSFSFSNWRQTEYFGLGEVPSEWFVSFLEKLKDLSQMQIGRFLSDGITKDRNRFHDINWEMKNVPIHRNDLDWLAPAYLDNPEEYPIVQFQISKALGRVVGFFDENYVFNIILLDKWHNIQPSKNYGYKVDDTTPLNCELSSFKLKSEKVIGLIDCPEKRKKAQAIIESTSYQDVELVAVDSDTKKQVRMLKNRLSVESTTEVFQYALMSVEEKDLA